MQNYKTIGELFLGEAPEGKIYTGNRYAKRCKLRGIELNLYPRKKGISIYGKVEIHPELGALEHERGYHVYSSSPIYCAMWTKI
jgi:hypothetical protein